MIDQIIEYNKTFVAQKGYEKYLTDKYLIKMKNILFALAAMIVWAACGNKQAAALAAAMAMSMKRSGMMCCVHSFATTNFLPPSTKITGGLQRI